MKYMKPEIRSLRFAMDMVRHAQNKGMLTVVDCIFPIFIFATPMAYEGDE